MGWFQSSLPFNPHTHPQILKDALDDSRSQFSSSTQVTPERMLPGPAGPPTRGCQRFLLLGWGLGEDTPASGEGGQGG